MGQMRRINLNPGHSDISHAKRVIYHDYFGVAKSVETEGYP